MEDLKQKLLDTGVINDNEYLDLYINLIYDNKSTKKQKGKTQMHHIIPRYYYNMIGKEVDNSSDNLVNLLYKYHLLAHYYLSLCAKGKFRYAMELSMILLRNTHKDGIDNSFIDSLDKYQDLYEENMKIAGERTRQRQLGVKQPKEVVRKRVAKNTGQKRTIEQRKRMSAAQKGRTFSDESKRKMSIAQQQMAATLTQEEKDLRVAHWKETMSKKSDEWKEQYRKKLSKAITGRPLGKHEIENRSKALKGKPKTEQHKISVARSASKYIYHYDNMTFYSNKEILAYLRGKGIDINHSRLKGVIANTRGARKWYPELIENIIAEPNPSYRGIKD